MGCLFSYFRTPPSNSRVVSFTRGAVVVEIGSIYWAIVPNHTTDVLDAILKAVKPINFIIAPQRTFANFYKNFPAINWINYWSTSVESNEKNVHNIRITKDTKLSYPLELKVNGKTIKILHFNHSTAILARNFKMFYVNIYGQTNEIFSQAPIIQQWCHRFDLIFYKIEESGRREIVEPQQLYEFHSKFGSSAKAIFLFDQVSESKKQFLRGLDTIVSSSGEESDFLILKEGKTFYLNNRSGEISQAKQIKEVLNQSE